MKYTTCQLVQGDIIRGYVHLIGAIGPNNTLWPLCDKPQVRLCERSPWKIYLTDRATNCPHCVKVTDTIPLAIDHTPQQVWAGV